ncbi:MAG: STAS domain-containing protein [Lentisphaeria bacterium]|nr:STAS domain-containing protein [Lentisphaeria bacterium]
MELKFDKIGNVLKISVSGRLVAACSEEFKETVSGWLGENRFLLFDLAGMSHIDSSGLGVLVYILQKANAQEGAVKLACLQPRPRIVFDITKVYRIFEIFDSIDAALASFEADSKQG